MKLKIAVLCGGTSPEREVSLASGQNVYGALKRIGHEAMLYDLDKVFFHDAFKRAFDAVFIALHGSPGEDGTVQGFLETLNIPYTGSGVLASSLAMNKKLSKAIFKNEGLSIANYMHFCEKELHGKKFVDLRSIELELGMPIVIKPSGLGSSVGISIVRDSKALKEAVDIALKYDCCVIAEEYIQGREIQCGIIGRDLPRPLPLIEIVPKNEFFDYSAKYTPGLADEITPAPLSEDLTAKGMRTALMAFEALGCRDFARVDMFLVNSIEFIVSEINTIPGLTKNSLLPKEARAAGMSFDELIEEIVQPTIEECKRKI